MLVEGGDIGEAVKDKITMCSTKEVHTAVNDMVIHGDFIYTMVSILTCSGIGFYCDMLNGCSEFMDFKCNPPKNDQKKDILVLNQL